ncbi:MAG: mucoidy inhibitor MuiA family protein, partial [Bdellovibrionota bacterium]
MKTILIFIFIVWLSSNVRAENSADEKQSNRGKVTAVTLYKDRAFVTRRKKLHLAPGNYALEFESVTPRLDRDSIKVIASEKKAVRILSVRTEDHFKKLKDNKKLKALLTERDALQREIALLFEQVNSILKENDYLNEISTHYRESFAINLHKKIWTKKEFEGLIHLLHTRAGKLLGKWKSLFESYQLTQDKIEFNNAKILELDSSSNSQVTSIWVNLEIVESVDCDLDVQYLVIGPGWNPAYDVRIDSKNRVAIIEINALLSQQSGEDWDNIDLTLSNLRSEIKPVVPTISPYTLSWQEVKKVKTTISTAIDDASELDMSPGLVGEVEGLAKNFFIKNKQNIPDGAQGTKVNIEAGRFPYREHLEVVAAQYLKVYKKAMLINEFPWALAAGEVTVYYDGDLVQNTTIETVPKSAKFYLNTGIDHSIQVSYWYDSNAEKKSVMNAFQKKKFSRNFHTYLENFSK